LRIAAPCVTIDGGKVGRPPGMERVEGEQMAEEELRFEQLSDEALWQAYVGGDDDAFAEVRRRYEGPLYWYLLLSLSSPRRAAEGLVKVMELAAAWRQPHDGFDSLKGWLYSIATQSVAFRRAGDEFGLSQFFEDLKMQPPRSRREKVIRALADLNRELRQPLLLVAVVGLSISEAARACNYTEQRTIACIERACRLLGRSGHFSVEEEGIGL